MDFKAILNPISQILMGTLCRKDIINNLLYLDLIPPLFDFSSLSPLHFNKEAGSFSEFPDFEIRTVNAGDKELLSLSEKNNE